MIRNIKEIRVVDESLLESHDKNYNMSDFDIILSDAKFNSSRSSLESIQNHFETALLTSKTEDIEFIILDNYGFTETLYDDEIFKTHIRMPHELIFPFKNLYLGWHDGYVCMFASFSESLICYKLFKHKKLDFEALRNEKRPFDFTFVISKEKGSETIPDFWSNIYMLARIGDEKLFKEIYPQIKYAGLVDPTSLFRIFEICKKFK